MPVVFEIVFEGTSGLFQLSEGYSAFPEEDEVLLQDGLQYSVIKITEHSTEDTNQQFCLI